MSSSRGSALLDLLVSTAIVAVVATAFLRTIPSEAIGGLRKVTSEAVIQRTIQLELGFIARSDRLGIAAPKVVDPGETLPTRIGSVSSPLPDSEGLLYVDYNGVAPVPITIHPDSIIGAAFSVPGIGISRAQTAIGCAPNRCVELRCRFERCSIFERSALLPIPSEVNPFPFLAVIYPASTVNLLYLSARHTLRKAVLVGDEIVENQPVLDRLYSFQPKIERPRHLIGAIVASAIFTLAPDGNRIAVSAFDFFAPAPLPLALLKFGAR